MAAVDNGVKVSQPLTLVSILFAQPFHFISQLMSTPSYLP
jgi:hypothetical protein